MQGGEGAGGELLSWGRIAAATWGAWGSWDALNTPPVGCHAFSRLVLVFVGPHFIPSAWAACARSRLGRYEGKCMFSSPCVYSLSKLHVFYLKCLFNAHG